ncbi:MAG: formate--tetrahydrofolate ligase [Candidatus Methanomethylophilaceae archaeon]
MKTDFEIARETDVRPIVEIAASLGMQEDDLVLYGRHMAKVPLPVLRRYDDHPDGKLILTTAITATPAGEGKTVTTIGLVQGLGAMGLSVMGALREPSLGPTFGIKGGATGGGRSQVYPMWDINLHFTGDIHAVGAAHNLLSALLENHMAKGNRLGIDPTQVMLRKAMDMNCRELRHLVVGLGGKKQGGIPHESGFVITSASEISAILALAQDHEDLRERLGRMTVAYTYGGRPVTAADLDGVGALLVLLKDAINPNLVQTLEGQPVFVHGFPFANIAHGTNSIIATRSALKMADYVVTESGFAADLGAEKFFDIVCRQSGLSPDAVVLVASLRALKMHGGASLDDCIQSNADALRSGFSNLDRHVSNTRGFGIPVVVCLNIFPGDTQEEVEMLRQHCSRLGVRMACSTVFTDGGQGALELAAEVLKAMEEEPKDFRLLYPDEMSIKEKVETVAKNIYGAGQVVFLRQAEKAMEEIIANGHGHLPVCMAKTQASITDNPELKGAPTGWKLTVREMYASTGAGFVVPVCGQISLMPGLPSSPSALRMDMDEDGNITGLH